MTGLLALVNEYSVAGDPSEGIIVVPVPLPIASAGVSFKRTKAIVVNVPQ